MYFSHSEHFTIMNTLWSPRVHYTEVYCTPATLSVESSKSMTCAAHRQCYLLDLTHERTCRMVH